MNTLDYHYKIKNSTDVIFQFPYKNYHPYCHFGDMIAILNMHLYFNNTLNLNGKLSIENLNDDEMYLAKLFFEENITKESPTYIINLFGSERENIDMLYEIYKNNYIKIKNLDMVEKKQYISYAYDGYSWLNKKIPSFFKDGIDKLKEKYVNYEFIEIGINIGLERTIQYIKESKNVITIDNGISHLCRCMNTPFIIIKKQGWDETKGFPKNHCTYSCYDSYNDMINISL